MQPSWLVLGREVSIKSFAVHKSIYVVYSVCMYALYDQNIICHLIIHCIIIEDKNFYQTVPFAFRLIYLVIIGRTILAEIFSKMVT